MVAIVELNSYPIKGCACSSSLEASVTPAGLQHDRSFMIVDENGVFRSQRRDPRLALVHPEVTTEGRELMLRAEGFDAVRVAIDASGPRRDVTLFRATYAGIDQGDAAADWFSEVLGAPSRLVRVPPEHDRVVDGCTPGTSGYADSSAVHLTTVESLRGLNERIRAKGGEPTTMDRFRANIVVAECDEPHLEDRVRRLVVGDVELAYSKLAIRCAVTMVDQRTATRPTREPLRTLADYRRTSRGVAFGVKFAVLRTGKLSVGDEIVVTSWDSPEL